ncbi:MAG: LuxR C-terminal-related transcriptional regulator [Dehalococcoidia bacterium]
MASPPSNRATSVILVSPHTTPREGICRILKDGGFDIIGQVESLPQLRRMPSDPKPDLVLVDAGIPKLKEGTIRSLVDDLPESSLVLLTTPNTSHSVLSGVQAGATGFLSLDLGPEEFIESLRVLAKGHIIISKDAADTLQKPLDPKESANPDEEISEREREVLELVGTGATNKEIAQELVVTEHTIKAHLRSILNKLDVRNRQQAAAFAVQQGLIKEIKTDDTDRGDQ